MKVTDFEDQGFMEVGMATIMARTKEARMTGVMEKTLMDLFLSRMVAIRPTKLSEDGSIIAPWSLQPQQHNINANYWEVEAGAAHPTAGAGGVPASAWQLTVKQHSGAYSTNLEHLEAYFLPGNYVTVVYKSGGGTGRTVQFKIFDSTNADAGGVNKAKITVIPNKSDAGWAGMSGGDQAIYQPTHGLLIPLVNSVSDYESWCYNRPSNNTWKFLEYWWQTKRRTYCYNDEYLKALNAPYTSEFFRKFRQLPLAQQKKLQFAAEEREWYNTIMLGEAITENQTQALYTSLPTVTDPLDPTCVLEYKSNTKGIRTQLAECGKVTDMAGAQLDFDVVKGMLYDLKRQREVDSPNGANRIDVMTDRFTRDNIYTMMGSYYRLKYPGWDIQRQIQLNQQLTYEGNIKAAGDMTFDIYDFPDDNVQLAVTSDTYFDDYLGALPAADKSMGRKLWGIDWSDVEIGIGGVRSVNRNSPDPNTDALYKCVIQPNVHHYTLESTKFQVRVPRPNRHFIIENFSGDCPTMTAPTCLGNVTSTSTSS